MKNMIDVDVFNNDERILLNEATIGRSLKDFSLSSFETSVSFSRSISTDPDVLDMLDGLLAKLKRISSVEWEAIKAKIPFETYYDSEDIEDAEDLE